MDGKLSDNPLRRSIEEVSFETFRISLYLEYFILLEYFRLDLSLKKIVDNL